jgi:hypothetical protein
VPAIEPFSAEHARGPSRAPRLDPRARVGRRYSPRHRAGQTFLRLCDGNVLFEWQKNAIHFPANDRRFIRVGTPRLIPSYLGSVGRSIGRSIGRSVIARETRREHDAVPHSFPSISIMDASPSPRAPNARPLDGSTPLESPKAPPGTRSHAGSTRGGRSSRTDPVIDGILSSDAPPSLQKVLDLVRNHQRGEEVRVRRSLTPFRRVDRPPRVDPPTDRLASPRIPVLTRSSHPFQDRGDDGADQSRRIADAIDVVRRQKAAVKKKCSALRGECHGLERRLEALREEHRRVESEHSIMSLDVSSREAEARRLGENVRDMALELRGRACRRGARGDLRGDTAPAGAIQKKSNSEELYFTPASDVSSRVAPRPNGASPKSPARADATRHREENFILRAMRSQPQPRPRTHRSNRYIHR